MLIRRNRVIALAAAGIAAVIAASAPAAQPDAAATPAIERLPNSARTVVENKRTYYLRLPSGFCIDAYRSIRVRDLLRERESRRRDEELESLGFFFDEQSRLLQIRVKEFYILEDGGMVSAAAGSGPPSAAARVVRLDDLPDWADLAGWTALPRDTGWTLFMDLPGFPELRFVEMSGPGRILAAIEPAPDASYVDDSAQRFQDGHGGLSPAYRRTEVVVRGPFRDMNLISGQRLTGSYLLYPSTETPQGSSQTPVFDLLYIDDIIPTAAEFAEAVEQGKAEVATYRYTKSQVQPTKKVRPSGTKGWAESRTVDDGPPITIYRYRRTPMPLRFIAARPAAEPPAPEPSQPETPDPEPPPPDTLALTDGRVLHGELVRETSDEVTFIVVVGGIRQEMTFARGAVDRIDRGRK